MLDSDLLTSPLEQVLLDLGAQGSTGCLYATDVSGEEAEVYLRDGSVYSVFVPGRRPLLGARLMSSGSLAPETLAEALEIQRTELQGWRLGELLVYLGFVDRDVVESFVSEQLVDMLTDLMRWDIATSKFRKNKKARQDVAPPQPVDALLAELRRRRGRWEELSEALGGPDTVPMLSAQGGAADDVVLGPGEWAMLCKVDGERSIADLAADCGYTLYEAAQVVHSLVEAGLVDLARDASALEAVPGAGDDGDWVVDDEPSDAELADSVERVRRALASMLEPDSTSPAAGAEPGTEAATAGPVSNGRASDRSQSRSLAELVAEAEAAEAEAASDVPELPARKSHLRVVEDDGQRRRREADEIAAEVEAARLKELGRIETDRRNKSDAVRQAVEDEAWGEHRLWLVMEQSAAEAEAWRFHRLWLAEQRAGDEDEAWQAHEQWMAAERARAEIRAWDEYARRLAAEVAAAEVEAWAEQAARMAAERVAAEAEAWAEQAARIAAERAAAEEPAWADHAAWLEAERAAAELAAWADHEARLAAEEAVRLAAEEAARLAAEEEAARLAAEEAARLAAEEEAVRLAAEEAARLAAEEEAARFAAEEEAARQAAEEEAARRAIDEAARIASEEEAARLAAEEATRVAAEAEAEAARLAAEEAAYYAAQEAANAAAQSDSELATVGASHDTHDAASVAYMLTQINAEASTAVAQAIRTQEAQAPAPVEEAAPPVIDSAGASRGQTDTAALLRELSGLFASGSEDSKPAGTSPPAAPAAPRQAPKDDGKKKKRGLFGR